MNALAVLERRDDMKNELANAPAIPSEWKLIISVRLHSISGDFEKAASDLDQLLKGNRQGHSSNTFHMPLLRGKRRYPQPLSYPRECFQMSLG